MGHLTVRAMKSEMFAMAHMGNPVPPAHRLVALSLADYCRDTPTAKTPARQYFGGWQLLAHDALNYTKWPNEAARKAVGRAITDLENRRLIRRLDMYRGRHRVIEILPYLNP